MNNGFTNQTVNALAVSGSNIFAGTKDAGVFRSTNNGSDFSPTNNGLTNLWIRALAVSESNIFAGTGSGVYRSTNNGTSWDSVNNGIPPNFAGNSFAVSGSNIFAAIACIGVYRSTNNGDNWSFSGLTDKCVLTLAVSGTNIFAGASFDEGIFRSTDNGGSWTAVNNGLTDLDVTSLTASGTNIFVGTGGGSPNGGVFRSTDNGDNWSLVINLDARSLTASGTNIFAGTYDAGIYVSTNNGANWIERNQGFGTIPTGIFSLLVANNYVFAGTDYRSLWRRPYQETIGIQNISSEVPSSFALYQNYPNPFNPTTKIKFDIPPSLQFPNVSIGNPLVVLKIFDALGREVATLVNEQLAPGTFETTFDASTYPSGVYFYKLTVLHSGSSTGNFTDTKRMVFIK